MSGPMRRILIGIAVALGAFFALTFLAVLIVPRDVATFVIRNGAALAGAGPIGFEVTEAGWRRLALARVSVGADQTIQVRSARLDFGWFGPFGGIGAARIEGLRIRQMLGGTGGGGGLSPALLPAFPLTLADTAIQLTDPDETFSAVSPGEIVLHGDASSGTLDLAVTPKTGGTSPYMPHHGALTLGPVMALTLAPVGAPVQGKARINVDLRLGPGTGVTLGVQDAALPASGFALKTLTLKGDAVLSGSHLTLTLADCMQIQGLVVSGLALDNAPLCNGEAGKPAVSLALAGGSDALAIDVLLKGASGRYQTLLSGTLPDLALIGESDAGLLDWSGTVKAKGGQLAAGGFIVSALDLDGAATAQDGRIAKLDATLAQATLSGSGPKPIIAPLTVTGSAKTSGSAVALTARAASGGIDNLLTADGTHDLRSGAGQATFKLSSLAFDPTKLKPETLSPALAGVVSEVKGGLSADGAVAWGANDFTSQGTLAFQKLEGKTSLARVQGLDGTIALSSLFPLKTATAQQLHVTLLDLGLPLTDGVITLSAGGSNEVTVNSAQWNFLGGKVGLSEGVFRPFGGTHSMTLAVDAIDLSQLLVLADVKGLSGSGKLSGRIPVTLEDGHQPVHGGQLAADPPGGIIVYKTGAATSGKPLDPSAILHTALDDFHYDTLTANIAGDLSGTLSLQVHLKGNNPSLYDGRRVELNLNTEGAFVDMLRKGVFGYRNAVKPQK